MNSAIEQNANQITQTVSTTYATKAHLNTVDGKFASYSTTTQMNSAIDQKANQITQTVSQTYTTKTEFFNLQIGVRNILRNSGGSSANTSYNTRNFATSNLKTNTKYTLVINGFTSVATQKIGVWFNNGSFHGGYFPVTTTAKTQYIVVTTPASLTTTQVNIYNYPSGSTRCTINWATMYEGDIRPPMDWTPAKEDTDASIELVENRTATLETNVNGITSRVTAVETKATTTANGLTNLTSRVSTAESKLTATSLITTFTTAINGGTKFTTTKFTMDNTGLTVKGGGIKIQNNAGTNVLYGETDGNLTFTGIIYQKSTSTGKTGVKIQNGQIVVNAYQNGDIEGARFIGYGGGGVNGMNIVAPTGNQIGIAFRRSDGKDYYSTIFKDNVVEFTANQFVFNNEVQAKSYVGFAGQTLYLKSYYAVECVNYPHTAYIEIKASNVSFSSLVQYKTDIKPFENALNVIRNTDVYSYFLKDEKERGRATPKVGLVIGGGFKTPTLLQNYDNSAIDGYTMSGVTLQAVKEVILENDLRDAKIEHLQQEIGKLKSKIWQLEQRLSVA